jgi:hypothetical protein
MGSELLNVDWASLPSKRELTRRLDQLDIPADGKVALAQLVEQTIVIGDRTLQVGRRILAFAFECLRQFPYMTFCSIVAIAISTILGGVPVLGWLLQHFVGPLVLAGGVYIGAKFELDDGAMRDRFDALADEFKAIFA